MIDVSWRIEDEDRDFEITGAPRPLLGTWHYLRNSLRRAWRTWSFLAVLGAAVGLAVVVLVPPATQGTVMVLMAHPANLDAQSAMATDLSLLNTREVSSRTVKALSLDVSPEAFQSTITAEPVTPEVLTISVSAPDGRSAVIRADALTDQYLTFRAEQLRSLTRGLIDGYKSRIDTLRAQVTSLTTAYNEELLKGADGQSQASDILTRRTQLNAQIVELQAALEDASLSADAAIASTHVIDPATVERRSLKRLLVLNVASGLIAGTALGVGLVLFRALTSTRVRRRQDVALALGAPVRYSVASRGPTERRFAPLRWISGPWHARDLATLVHGLASALPDRSDTTLAALPAAPVRASWVDDRQQVVAMVAIGNAGVAAEVMAALALQLNALGRAVLLVDLSPSGALVAHLSSRRFARRASRMASREASAAARALGSPTVFRPTGAVGLARGPLRAARGDSAALRGDEFPDDAWAAADVVLVLADVDPGIDAESLASWVGRAVPLVTAGQSSPELLQTTAELVRAAGLELPFAMMVGSDDTDESLGLKGSHDSGSMAGSQR